MIMLLEEAALSAVEKYLTPGHKTVGTQLNIDHIAATPVGMRVVAHAEVAEIKGRKLIFKVWADDESERICEGTHERIVVELERFDKRIASKAGSG